MIKITNVIKCYQKPVNPLKPEAIEMVIENLDGDISQTQMLLTIHGNTYQVDVRDLQDACRNVTNGGAR